MSSAYKGRKLNLERIKALFIDLYEWDSIMVSQNPKQHNHNA